MLSPAPQTFIRKPLPYDILLQIFRFDIDRPRRVIQLAQVCGWWREVIEGYPVFWSTIHLDTRKRAVEDQAAHWLKHAGTRLLDIHIDLGHHSELVPDEASQAARLARALRGTESCWKSVAVSGCTSHIKILLRGLEASTTNLSHLLVTAYKDVDGSQVFRGGNDYGVNTLPLLEIPFDSHPSSNDLLVELVGSTFTLIPSFGTGITRLTLEDGGTPLAIASALRSCPNLKKLHLQGRARKNLGFPQPLKSVDLPHIVDLSVSYVLDIENLLVWLNLPALQHLKIFQATWSHALVSVLWALFHSWERLSSVYFDDEESIHSEAVNLDGNPPLLPSLTRLHARGNPTLDKILGGMIIPNIQTLELATVACDVAHHIVSSSAALHTLSLDDIEGSPQSSTPIPLPALTTLEVVQPMPFIRVLDVSNITFLTIGGYSGCKVEPSLQELLARCGHTLTTLCIIGVEDVDSLLSNCLEQLTSLETLELQECQVSDTFLRALSSKQGAIWLLPRLKKIDFQSNDGITLRGITEFLASRNTITSDKTSPPCIRGVISFDENITEADAASIKVSLTLHVHARQA